MITFKSFISEEFYDGFKLYDGLYEEVFINPTKSELRQFNGSIRFIIDLQDKKIYVWNAHATIHYYMIRQLQKTKGILLDLPSKTGEAVYIPSLHRYIQGTIFDGRYISDLYEMFEDNFDQLTKDNQVQLISQFEKLVTVDMDWIDKYLPLDHIKLKEMLKGYVRVFKYKYSLLAEELISPSTESDALSLWHGGSLDSGFDENYFAKKGKTEYGSGLYLTTSYNVVQKYTKGSRKLYMVTIMKGTNIDEVNLPISVVVPFIKKYVIKNKYDSVIYAIENRLKNEEIDASIFHNILINNDAIKPSNSNNLRRFLVEQGIDYSIVDNPFGWGERMVVLFNMKLILKSKVVKPKDKIELYDLPTEWQ